MTFKPIEKKVHEIFAVPDGKDTYYVIETERGKNITVFVSPKGNSIRAFKNGKEMFA